MSKSISIVIPTFNKASYLLLTLASLAQQTFHDFELLIVDDGSTDETNKVICSLSSWFDNLQYIKQDNLGRSRARNRGIQAASGDILILTEDDHITKPDFVDQHRSCHEEQSDTVVVGGIGHRIITHLLPQKILAKYLPEGPARQDLEFTMRLMSRTGAWAPIIFPSDIANNFRWVESLSFPDTVLADRIEYVEHTFGKHFEGFALPWLFFGGGNVSAPLCHIESVGGFCELFTGWGSEDLEMGFRLFKSGIPFTLNRETRSFHQVHDRDRTRICTEAAKNQELFCKLHPEHDVFLFTRYDNPQYSGLSAEPISLVEYNERSLQYRRASEREKRNILGALHEEIDRCTTIPDSTE